MSGAAPIPEPSAPPPHEPSGETIRAKWRGWIADKPGRAVNNQIRKERIARRAAARSFDQAAGDLE